MQCPDPRSFVLYVSIGIAHVLTCMVDSEASRNVLSKAIYRLKNLPPLQLFEGKVWFGNQVQASPEEVVTVMVYIEGHQVPTEFLVVKTTEAVMMFKPKVILGLPFLATTRAK